MGDPAESTSLRLSVLEHRLAVCRLEHDSEIPASATGAPFFCVTRTADELSVDCPEELIPAGTACERGWRALEVEGPPEFGLTGVLASLAVPLAESKIGILAIAKSQLDLAAQSLRERGHEVHEP
ncbi:MAG TPA: ACT domain-containing protein [Rubrobacteraceae bacterium]|nr:ACT domain-containing protein [Rubrobacteraceae bacterium]